MVLLFILQLLDIINSITYTMISFAAFEIYNNAVCKLSDDDTTGTAPSISVIAVLLLSRLYVDMAF